MVTILRPRIFRRASTPPSIVDEDIPKNGDDGERKSAKKNPKGIELSPDAAGANTSTGSSSAPGEGPNPTI